MTASAAHMKATKKYEDKAYKKILVRLPKELESAFIEKSNGSMNGYIIDLIKKDLGIQDNQKGDGNNE